MSGTESMGRRIPGTHLAYLAALGADPDLIHAGVVLTEERVSTTRKHNASGLARPGIPSDWRERRERARERWALVGYAPFTARVNWYRYLKGLCTAKPSSPEWAELRIAAARKRWGERVWSLVLAEASR